MNTNATEERSEETHTNSLSQIKNKFIILSGKGGVGKSTIAVNLAFGLAKKGYEVGIMDVDLHGPNVAKMLRLSKERINISEEGIDPVEVLPNLKAVSMAFFLSGPDQPVIWRGPLKI